MKLVFKTSIAMVMKNKLEQMDYPDAVLLATHENSHRQIASNHRTMRKYYELGFDIYAIINNSVYFFCDDKMGDGIDWVKITYEKMDVCSECGTEMEYDWHVEYDTCPKCGCDIAK